MLIKDAARNDARSVLMEHWDSDTFPVEPVAIAQKLGAKVFLADMDESGMIIQKDGGPVEIFLSHHESPLRRRFTCAHEIGHLVDRQRRRDTDYSFVDRRSGRADNAFEWYADHFAANLLMPQDEVERLQDLEYPLEQMADHFGVSHSAMRVRLRLLNQDVNARQPA